MTRQQKSPKQRAQEALDVAERHVTRLTKQEIKLRSTLQAVTSEKDAAVARRDYLKAHPDLGQPATSTTRPTTSTGATT